MREHHALAATRSTDDDLRTTQGGDASLTSEGQEGRSHPRISVIAIREAP